MKKLFIVSSILVLSFFFFKTDAIAQRKRLTAPEFVFGISPGLYIATNHASGQVGNNSTYGMRFGRGFTLYAKYAFDKYRKHRITSSLTFQKMVNDKSGGIFLSEFFNFSPEEPYTNFNIYTGTIGYEYVFGAPCCDKQNIGVGISYNLINSTPGNHPYEINNSFRIGFQLNAGYEFLIDEDGKYGLDINVKWNIANIFLQDVGSDNDLNDGTGIKPYTSDEKRRYIGLFGINLGFNFYTDVKERKIKIIYQ